MKDKIIQVFCDHGYVCGLSKLGRLFLYNPDCSKWVLKTDENLYKRTEDGLYSNITEIDEDE